MQILEVKYDTLRSFTSADMLNGRKVFVSVCFSVGGSGTESNSYLIFGSGTKLYVTGKAQNVFRLPDFIVFVFFYLKVSILCL